MSLITFHQFNHQFSTDFPEMIDCYCFEEDDLIEESTDYSFKSFDLDGSDTYVDLDDYEFQQGMYL